MISTIIISWWLLWETINRLWWHWWEGETGGARVIFANSEHCVFLFTNYNLIMDLFCTWVCFLIIVRLAGDNYKFALHNYACVEDKPKAQTVFRGWWWGGFFFICLFVFPCYLYVLFFKWSDVRIYSLAFLNRNIFYRCTQMLVHCIAVCVPLYVLIWIAPWHILEHNDVWNQACCS